jgi:hypothetical protein
MEVGLVAQRNEQCNGFVCPSVVNYLYFTTLDLNIIENST